MDRAPLGWVHCRCGFESSPFKSSAKRPSVEVYVPAPRIDRKNAKVNIISFSHGEVCAKLENALADSAELDSDCLACMMRLGNLVVHQRVRLRAHRLRVHKRVRATNPPANRAHRHRCARTLQADQAV